VSDDVRLTPDLLVRAYANGLFPMGDDHTGTVRWYSPDPRAHLPLAEFHVPDTLHRRVRAREFEVTSDRAFDRVIQGCADRERTWITPRIIRAYSQLHQRGRAHSVECWHNDTLAGGLYGVSVGGAFFGESMFFRVSNASKVALVHLVRQLRAGGFSLLDTQYSTAHLERFGVVEIPRAEYMDRLAQALAINTTWWPLSDPEAAALHHPVSEFVSSPPKTGNDPGSNG
jgi:leucyl/phenylalanyl-tRNA--protein transferase